MAAGDAAQAIPDLPMPARLVLLVVPGCCSRPGRSMIALVSEMVPEGSFVFARATINIAVGVDADRVGLGGLLLLTFSTSQLFLGAAAACLVALVLVRLGIADHPPRASGPAVRRSRAVNRLLLGSRVLRPVYLALWVPNGLVVGCEALIVPFAGDGAGFLFAATAVGMLTGDVLMGTRRAAPLRDRLVEPARILLAVALAVLPARAVARSSRASSRRSPAVGYCASLPLQERLVSRTAGGHPRPGARPARPRA